MIEFGIALMAIALLYLCYTAYIYGRDAFKELDKWAERELRENPPIKDTYNQEICNTCGCDLKTASATHWEHKPLGKLGWCQPCYMSNICKYDGI